MAKKSFKDISPADRLLDKAGQGVYTPAAHDAGNVDNMDNADNTAYTHNEARSKAEARQTPGQGIKSKRVQMLIYPDVMEDIKKIAHMQRKSVNGLINELLDEYRREHAADLEQYKEIYKEG